MANFIQIFTEFIKQTPTGDNCQSWEFSTLDNKTIKCEFIPDRDKHEFNKYETATRITFGFLLAYIRKAQEIFEIELEIVKKNYDLTLSIKSEVSDEKLKQIQTKTEYQIYLNRRTDRRTFEEVISDDNLIKSRYLISNRQIKSTNKDLLKYCMSAEKNLFSNSKVLKDLFKWIRFSDSEYYKLKDGMHYKQINLKVVDIPFFRLLKTFPKFFAFLFSTPLFIIPQFKIKLFYKNSNLIFYGKDNTNLNNIEEFTKSILEDWVMYQAQGYSYQPMNILALPYIGENDKPLPELENLKNILGIEQYPIWVARVGKVNSEYKIPKSLRI